MGGHRGEPGHTRDTRDTRAHAGTRITRTNLTTIHPNPTTQTRTKTATDSTAARTETGTVAARSCATEKCNVQRIPAPPGVFLPILVDSGLAAVLAAVESVAVFVRVCVVGFDRWMVVRFVRVIRAVFVRVCVRLGLGGWL